MFALSIAIALSSPAVPVPSCAAIVDDETRAKNARERAARVQLLRSVDGVIEIVYEGVPLRGPFDAEDIGVRIVGRATDEGGDLMARFVVVGEAAQPPCSPFFARVDDSLPRGAVVIAVLEEGALLAQADALIFARARGARPPTFRLAWRSSFTLDYPHPAAPRVKAPRATKRR